MSDPKPPPPAQEESLSDRLRAEAAKQAASAAVSGAVAAIGKAADGALDAVEKLLFGKVGAAEEVVKREAEADPMARLRVQYGLGEKPATPPPEPAPPAVGPGGTVQARSRRQQAEDEARRQLEALKQARAARGADPTPVERTAPGGPVAAPPAGSPSAPTPADATKPGELGRDGVPVERKRTL